MKAKIAIGTTHGQPRPTEDEREQVQDSDYLLSGILHAKQDGGPLAGVLCGGVGHKVRYYRHRRGRTGYRTGSVFNKVIHAETVENAVIDAVNATLLDTANLREKLLAMITAESQSAVGVDVDDLKREWERLKKRTG